MPVRRVEPQSKGRIKRYAVGGQAPEPVTLECVTDRKREVRALSEQLKVTEAPAALVYFLAVQMSDVCI